MPRLNRAATTVAACCRRATHLLAQPRGLVLNDDRRVVLHTLLVQLVVCLSLAGTIAIWSRVAGMSALLGGMAVVIPNGFLAARLLTPRAASAHALLRAAWIGEIGKLLLTALAFGVIFAAVRPLSVPAVFAGFIVTQTALFGALLLGSGAATATKEKLKNG